MYISVLEIVRVRLESFNNDTLWGTLTAVLKESARFFLEKLAAACGDNS